MEYTEQQLKEMDYATASKIAKDPTTSPEALAVLSEDPSEYIRECVAKNPNTPEFSLIQLSTDDDDYVLRNVAFNPSTPSSVLSEMAKNQKDRSVRRLVGENPNTPIEILEHLANDAKFNVRMGVAHNPKATEKALISIYKKEIVDPKGAKIMTIDALFRHKNTPSWIKAAIEARYYGGRK